MIQQTKRLRAKQNFCGLLRSHPISIKRIHRESVRHPSAHNQRVLAIDPYSQGFGFAVLEGPERLIDYGLKKVRGDKNSACFEKIIALIEYYQPDVILLRDSTGKGSRRSLRVQTLIQEILKLALSKRIKARTFSRVEIRKSFSLSSAATNHQLACIIAPQFPELIFRLPPPRKAWMSEDERMSIFVAVSLALTFFCIKQVSTR